MTAERERTLGLGCACAEQVGWRNRTTRACNAGIGGLLSAVQRTGASISEVIAALRHVEANRVDELVVASLVDVRVLDVCTILDQERQPSDRIDQEQIEIPSDDPAGQ